MLTEDLPTLGVDGNDAISLRLEILGNAVSGFSLFCGGSHDRDSFCLLVNAQELLA